MTTRTVVCDSGVQYLEDCAISQARGSAAPVRAAGAIAGGCVACARTASLDTHKRAGAMLGKALLPAKKRPGIAAAATVWPTNGASATVT